MSKLFLYYSHTGNGKVVASKMKELGYEIREVKPKKDISSKFFPSMMQGGFLALIHAKSKLVSFDSDISSFDEVVLGSPIWNGRLSSPINTVLSKLDLASIKKLSFVLYAGSGKAPKAEKYLRKKYPNASILVLMEPKKQEEELKKLEEI